MQERLAERRRTSTVGQLVTQQQVEATRETSHHDDHRSGNLYGWDQNVYGAD